MIVAVDCGSSRFPDIVQAITGLGFKCESVPANDFLYLPAEASGVVISGSPWLLAQKPSPLTESMKWLFETEVPVLGICFGHQLIGLIHGCEVFTGPPERDLVQPEITGTSALFNGIESGSGFCADHTEGITIPGEFELLARSVNYPVEAMKHRNKNVYGVQFHPESSGETGSRLIGNFLDLCHKS